MNYRSLGKLEPLHDFASGVSGPEIQACADDKETLHDFASGVSGPEIPACVDDTEEKFP